MLKVFDRNHQPLGILSGYKDCYIEEVLKEGTKTLSFKISATNSLADKIEEEGYIQTADYEFVIKEYMKDSNDYYSVFCNPNVEELTGTPLQSFECVTNTVAGVVNLALSHVSTWSCIDKTVNQTQKRTLRKEIGTVKEIIDYCKSVFNIEIEYDTMNKKVILYDKRGEDKGVFFTNEHDMSQFQIQSTSYNFITRIYPFGANDASGKPINISSVNNGQLYIDNNSYSNKVVAAIWIDERYKIPQNLKDDAAEKLAELAAPAHSYTASIVNLGKDVAIGDTVTFIDNIKKTREKQRVVSIVHYPFEPEKDKVTLSNTRVSFADKIAALDEAAQLIQDNTDDNGVVKYAENAGSGGGGGGTIPDPLIVNKIVATEGEIGTSTVNKETVTDLTATNGKISALTGSSLVNESIETDDLLVKNALQTPSITVTGAYIGTLTSENFVSGTIDTNILKTEAGWIKEGMLDDAVVGTAQIADGSITSAKIVDLVANKITSGTLSVERLIISGNEQSLIFALNNMGDLVSTTVDSLDGGVLTERSITADKIVAGAITSNEIAANTIKGSNIEANTIATGNLAAGAVTSVKIATGAVEAGHIDAYAVTAEKIAAGAITSDKLDTKAVMASNLNDDVFEEVRRDVEAQINQYQAEVEQYMHFDTDTGLTLGGVGSDFAVNINNQEIGFKEGGNTVAYINNQKISITDGEVLNEMRIGNYVFKPRANGNMSLVYQPLT